MTPPRTSDTGERTVVELEQVLYWEVDVTDSMTPGCSYTDDELIVLAVGVGEYKEWSIAEGLECTGVAHRRGGGKVRRGAS